MLRIAANREGIGSRLECLLSVMRMAELQGDDYKIRFENNHNAGCNWHDLFENNIETDIDVNVLEYPKVYYSWKFDLTYEERQQYTPKNKYIDFLFDKTPEPIKSQYIEIAKKLIPVEYIRDQIRDFKHNFTPTTISACIRAWKDVRDTPMERAFYFEEYIKAIDDNLYDFVYLTTDDKSVFKKMRKRYGAKLLFYPKQKAMPGYSCDWRSVIGMQEALIELYLAGLNRLMIVTWHSQYNDCQWWFGGGKSQVIEVSKWKI